MAPMCGYSASKTLDVVKWPGVCADAALVRRSSCALRAGAAEAMDFWAPTSDEAGPASLHAEYFKR